MSNYGFQNPVDFLCKNVEERPNATAFVFEGTFCTYAEIKEKVASQISWLRKHNINRGSKVGLYCDNDLQLMTSLFAVWSVGAVAIPLNVTQTREKLLQIVDTLKPDIVLREETAENDGIFTCEVIEMEGISAQNCDKVEIKADDVAIVMFTSGTSGVPKAVPITYQALGHNCYQTACKLAISDDDRILINSPPYYTSAIVHNLTMFSQGASVVVDRSMLLGNAIFDLLEKYSCTGFGGVPVHFTRIDGCLKESSPSPKLRFLMNSGEHLPVPLLQKIHKELPKVQIYCVYGLTEVGGRLCILPPDRVSEKAGSVGTPLPGMEITVRDTEGNLLQKNEMGEIYVSGLTLMAGYVNNDTANLKSMKDYGFATGDIGKVDEDGYLFLEGRTDDIMKVGGEKVSLKMIEEQAMSFPDFFEVIAAPIKHDLMGNVPCLYYTLKPGIKIKKKDVLKYLRSKLPANHVPAFIKEIEKIPRATSGKKLRSFLN